MLNSSYVEYKSNYRNYLQAVGMLKIKCQLLEYRESLIFKYSFIFVETNFLASLPPVDIFCRQICIFLFITTFKNIQLRIESPPFYAYAFICRYHRGIPRISSSSDESEDVVVQRPKRYV